jgi:hypothetical protein
VDHPGPVIGSVDLVKTVLTVVPLLSHVKGIVHDLREGVGHCPFLPVGVAYKKNYRPTNMVLGNLQAFVFVMEVTFWNP